MNGSGIDRRQRYLSIGALAVLLIAVVVAVALVWAGVGDESAGNASGGSGSARDWGRLRPAGAEAPSGDISATVYVPDSPAYGISQVSAVRSVPSAVLIAKARASATASATGRLAGRIICIDPGHASNTNSGTEPIGPGSTETKTTEPGGTSGVASGIPEHIVTLAIGLELRKQLESEGARVIMVREGQTFDGLARDRPLIASKSGASLFVRIHCDGSTNSAANGASTLYPASIPGWTDDIAIESRRAADSIQAALVSGLGVPDLGTVERSDMLGFNWSDVPAVLAEVGFMSNEAEDLRLVTPAYQRKVATSLSAGILDYFSAGQQGR
ncbi:MAG: N-acetylmuramoyl-L-alanine amidase [Thermoleophilia bacterium]|nr:N-acetylmuramoyl-L-alanine amidase [Thermoleophilia bacterium]